VLMPIRFRAAIRPWGLCSLLPAYDRKMLTITTSMTSLKEQALAYIGLPRVREVAQTRRRCSAYRRTPFRL
jgi:hypothetical protein